ncbi:MAG: SpoIIE family protein phosphatase, partial [Parachlamydiales bacterium]|nr:SpoIIE family protein phosphatase [Parachlamydiales bacterium]
MFKRSLVFRIFLASLIIVILPLTIFCAFLLEYSLNTIKKDSFQSLQRNAEDTSFLLSQLSIDNYNALRAIEIALDIPNAPPSKPDEVMSRKMSTISSQSKYQAVYFLYLNEEQKYICTASSDNTMIGKDLSDNPYVEKVKEYRALNFVYYGPKTDDQSLYVMELVKDGTGKVVGMMGLRISLEQIAKSLMEHFNTLPYQVSILDYFNTIFVSTLPELNFKKVVESSRTTPETNVVVLKDAYPKYGVQSWTLNNITYIGYLSKAEGTDFSVLVGISEASLIGRRIHLIVLLVVLSLSMVIATILIAILVSRRMAKPLRNLNDTMEKISDGSLQARYVDDPMGYEINKIGSGFNHMITALLSNMEIAKNEQLKRELLSQQLDLGRSIQLSILPQEMPHFPSVTISAKALPALEVGGDFYDVFVKPQTNQLFICIADAADKGISACLYSIALRSMLRSFASEFDQVTEIISKSNNLFMFDSEASSMFVTAQAFLYNPDTKIISSCSCGHPPSLLIHSNGIVDQLLSDPTVLGISELKNLKENHYQLQSNDLLLLYTDGVTEAINHQNEQYGLDRLIKFVQDRHDLMPSALIDAIIQDVQEFSAGTKQHDDITLV